MERIFIAVLVMIAVTIFSATVFSDQANTVSGEIVILRVEGAGNFYYLKDSKGREIFLCGVGEPVNDPSKQWIAKAEKDGQTVTLRGNIVKDGDGFTFENSHYDLISPKHIMEASAELRGPVIMGFQLGMPYDQALATLKKMGGEIHNNSGGLGIKGVIYMNFDSNRDVNYLEIPFNNFVKGNVKLDDFVKSFISHYKIPVTNNNIHVSGNQVSIDNSDYGYKISIGGDIRLYAVEKGEINFK